MLKIGFKDIKDENRLDGIVGIAKSLQVKWEDPFPTPVESSPTKCKSALQLEKRKSKEEIAQGQEAKAKAFKRPNWPNLNLKFLVSFFCKREIS